MDSYPGRSATDRGHYYYLFARSEGVWEFRFISPCLEGFEAPIEGFHPCLRFGDLLCSTSEDWEPLN